MKRLLLILLILFSWYRLTNATDYYVDPRNGSNNTGNGSQTNPWRTISFALLQIDNCATVSVSPGTLNTVPDKEGWAEVFPIFMENCVSIIGVDGADSTFLDAEGTARVIQCADITDTTTTIEGFTITGGNNDGIFCSNSSLTIINNIINNNQGSGIAGSSSSPRIYHNLIYGNYDLDADGAGINLSGSNNNPIIQNNTVRNNTYSGSWRAGGGIQIYSGNPVITHNVVDTSTVTGSFAVGFGIYCGSGNPIITENFVNFNTASGGFSENAGIWLGSGVQSAIVTENTVANSDGYDMGVGIYSRADTTLISFNRIKNNEEGINCGSQVVTIISNTIKANIGNGIYSSGADSIAFNVIEYNGSYGISCNSTSAVMENNTISRNGKSGIYLTKPGHRIVNNIFFENTDYGIEEIDANTDPDSCIFNDYYGNVKGLYYNEGLSPITTIAVLHAFVPECKTDWYTENSIDSNPSFVYVSTDSVDYQLQENSPCIDRGHPYSPLDPDGTRADIGAFYFNQGSFIVISPNGGEDWQVGSSQDILWTPLSSIDSVKLEYATDDGNGWITIADSTSNDGSYTWTIPNTPSTNCLVKISDALDGDPWDVSDSTFTISAPPGWDITGRIGYYSNDDPVDDASVKLKHIYLDTTDVSGNYEFLNLPTGNYVAKPEKENDLGTPSAISAFDAAWILQYGVGLRTFEPCQMIAADVTGNGSVSAYDAAHILQWGVGLITHFPVMPDSTHYWRFVPDDFSITLSNWMNAPDSISYTPLNSDTTDNYEGIIYGDVTGNWQPTEGGMAKSIVATANIRLEQVTGKPGDNISLPMYVDNASDIIAMNFTLIYDPKVLEAVGASLTSLTQDYLIAHHVAEGRLKVALAGSQPIVGSGAIVNLEFEVFATESSDAASLLQITEMVINEGSIVANIQAAKFEMKSTVPTEYALHQNYPNPFNPETVIKYQLPKPGKVVLRIYNSLGQEIRTLVNEEIEAGYHEIRWNGRDDSGVLTASGIYIYRIQAGDFVSIKKMLFLR